MRCVAIDAGGNVVDVVPQPSDVTSCTLVLAVPAELQADLFRMDLVDAGAVSLAIISLWAVAFSVRLLIRFLWSS